MQEEQLTLTVFQTMNFILVAILLAQNSAFLLQLTVGGKASNNNDGIINFTYHHQLNSKTKTLSNIIKVPLIHIPLTLLYNIVATFATAFIPKPLGSFSHYFLRLLAKLKIDFFFQKLKNQKPKFQYSISDLINN